MKSESFIPILFIEFNLQMHNFLASKELYRPVGLLVGPFVCWSVCLSQTSFGILLS